MKNMFRTRVKYGPLYIHGRKCYTVKYRKWWQLRWHGLTAVHPWHTEYEYRAKKMVERIEKGEVKV